MNMNNAGIHPIAAELGLQFKLIPDEHLYFYPVPPQETSWEVARITLTTENHLEFCVKDGDRVFSAVFNQEGRIIKLECSDGLPSGTTEEIAAMFCEQARCALEDLRMLH